jgi:hypothetical protein
MTRNQTSLFAILLSALLAVASFTLTGCQTIRDFEESNPIAYDLIKGTSKAILLSQIPNITTNEFERAALQNVVLYAFSEAAEPQGVAALIATELAALYPDDAGMREEIAAVWAEALRAQPTEPASAPGARQYQLDLAAAL